MRSASFRRVGFVPWKGGRHPMRDAFGLVAASGMSALLLGVLTTHRRSGDRLQEATPALVAFAASLAYLAVALTR